MDKFRVLLEQRAGDHPVLVSLDDLHWADRATLAALRVLPSQLAAYPLVWQLARSTAAPGSGAALLFDLLERDGADRVTLGPLSDDAVAGVAADVLHAMPDGGLAELAAGAGGNPYLLVELLTGLREEDAIQVARGRATLLSARLPDRVQVAVRAWLGGLNRRVRPLLETAAVLGRSFRLEDVAEMLGEAPAALLPLLNEALQAGLLATGTDDFSFRHGLVWQAITESVPLPARLALHRQFGGMLLARGGSAVAAGAHLLASARPGDTAAIDGLDQAAAEALGAAPATAADLAVRALELTAPADPARMQRSARAAEALAAAGRLADARNIARVALAQPLPAAAAAPLRCAISAILAADGHPDQADAMAESVLATPGLTSRLRDEAMITQLRARAVLGDTSRSRSLAEAILAAPDQHSVSTVAGAQLVLAAVSWEAGWASRGLGHARSAVRRISGISPVTARPPVAARRSPRRSATVPSTLSATEQCRGRLCARAVRSAVSAPAAAASVRPRARSARARRIPGTGSVPLDRSAWPSAAAAWMTADASSSMRRLTSIAARVSSGWKCRASGEIPLIRRTALRACPRPRLAQPVLPADGREHQLRAGHGGHAVLIRGGQDGLGQGPGPAGVAQHGPRAQLGDHRLVAQPAGQPRCGEHRLGHGVGLIRVAVRGQDGGHGAAQRGRGGGGQRLGQGHPRDVPGVGQAARRGQRLGGPGGPLQPGRVRGRGQLQRPHSQVGGGRRGGAKSFRRGLVQAIDGRCVAGPGAGQQVRTRGHGRAAAGQQHPAELAVQGQPGGQRHGLGNGLPDQAVPEAKVVRPGRQQTGLQRLVQQRKQRRWRLAQHLGHVLEPERPAEHGRGLQQRPDPAVQATEPGPHGHLDPVRQPGREQRGPPPGDLDGVFFAEPS